MARTIFKYPIPIQDDFGINMPQGAEVLHVDVQRDQACVWALVDPRAPYEVRHFSLYGTGHNIDDADYRPKIHHVGSFQLADGLLMLVFHLFERKA